MYLFIRPLITNLTCPGDSSLYVEWAQPDTFYHGVDKYNLFIRYRSDILTSIHWESRYCSFLLENNVDIMYIMYGQDPHCGRGDRGLGGEGGGGAARGQAQRREGEQIQGGCINI